MECRQNLLFLLTTFSYNTMRQDLHYDFVKRLQLLAVGLLKQ